MSSIEDVCLRIFILKDLLLPELTGSINFVRLTEHVPSMNGPAGLTQKNAKDQKWEKPDRLWLRPVKKRQKKRRSQSLIRRASV